MLHFTRTSIWHETGLRITTSPAVAPTDFRRDAPKVALAIHIENLNPSVSTTHVMTRLELARTAMWLMWRAVRGHRKLNHKEGGNE